MRTQKQEALEKVKKQLDREVKNPTKPNQTQKVKDSLKTSRITKKRLNKNKKTFLEPYDIYADKEDDGNTYVIRFTKVTEDNLDEINKQIDICNKQIRHIINCKARKKDMHISGTKYITFRPYITKVEIIYNIKCRGLDQAIFILTELTIKSKTKNIQIIKNKLTTLHNAENDYNIKAENYQNTIYWRKLLIYNAIQQENIKSINSIKIEDVELFTSTITTYDKYDFNPMYRHQFWNEKPKCRTSQNFGIFHKNTKQ